MSEQGRIWIASDGERYEARLRRQPRGVGALTFRRLEDGPVWSIAVGPEVSLVALGTEELEALLRLVRGWV